MRTAEEILEVYIMKGKGKGEGKSESTPFSIDPYEVFQSMREMAKLAINEARKEAIEECAEIAGTDCDIYNHSVDKESILSLINELK